MIEWTLFSLSHACQRIVRQEVEKKMIEIAAEAEAEKTRREANGQAAAILLKYQAKAEGVRKALDYLYKW